MADKPVINIDEAEYQDWGAGGKFQAQFAPLSPRVGARKLGYNVVVLQPGKTAWPYHRHYVNEELFLILEGTGRLRFEDQEHALRQGDLVCCPPGHSAHQIINDSDTELRYLAISTMASPEIAEYPDSDKLGVLAGALPGQEPTGLEFRMIIPKDAGVDYWQGETVEDD